ncbi:hypothetical protein RND81_08G106900 [Saponaria officinalis]|uniref:Uncharacterized protein n=1 Tax=Saponaria officinalis TaxID=3572 RepID=A0AAW1J5V7_SAPOF
MACVQQIRASCESDYSEKEKTVSKDSQGRVSSEHNKHGHKTAAYATEGGYQAVGANGHQTCNSATANKHPGHLPGHLSLTEKVTGLFSSKKAHQGSGCNTHGHQTSEHVSHGHQASSHGNQGHIVPAHVSHGHNSSGCNTHGHQTSDHGHQACSHGSHGHIVTGQGSHGHNSSGCNSSSHSHHKAVSKETYEFEEKKEYKSCKTGGHKKVEKKVKKSSYKSSSSDSETDKEHC